MAFGFAIKKLREDVGISVEKLAGKIGVNSSRWRKWEEKDFDPRDEDQAEIERFFGMPLAEVTALTSIKDFLNVPNTSNNQKKIKTLSPDEILTVLALANDKYADTLRLQAELLRDIRKDMARADSQNDLKISLDNISEDVTRLVERQETAIDEFRDEFLILKGGKTTPSKGARKKGGRSDHGGKRSGIPPA